MASKQDMVSAQARPGPISIDPARTAVLVVDMQNDFGAKGGMFDRAGIDITLIQKAVGPTGQVLAAARKAGIRVVYLKMEHKGDLSDAGPADSPHWIKHQLFSIGKKVTAPDGQEGRVLVKGTWNTEILSDLAPEEGDIVVSKHRYSGFYQTELDRILKDLGIKYLIVTGCTTSVCVESTVRDAMFRDYSCLVLEDCTAEPIGHDLQRSNHEASLLVIELLLGWVTNSYEVINALEQVSRD